MAVALHGSARLDGVWTGNGATDELADVDVDVDVGGASGKDASDV